MPEQAQAELYKLAFEQSLDDAIETADEYLSRADQIAVMEEKLEGLKRAAGGLNG